MPVFPLSAHVPRESRDAEDDEAEDGRVGLPVFRLRIPTTGRRPDVLGIAASRRRLELQFDVEVGGALVLRGNSRDSGTAALQYNTTRQ